jgi:hypothetical protein
MRDAVTVINRNGKGVALDRTVLKPSFDILAHHEKKGTIIAGQNRGGIVDS